MSVVDMPEVFWRTLAMHLALDPMSTRQRVEALRWLGTAASAPDRKQPRIKLAYALETGLIDVIERVSNDIPLDAIRPTIVRMLVPLLESPLVNDMNITVRRLACYLGGLGDSGLGRKKLSGRGGQDVFDIVIPESEEETAGAEAFRAILDSPRSTDVRLTGTVLGFPLKRDVPESGEQVHVPTEVPLIHLVLSTDGTLRDAILHYLTSYFAVADPGLAERLVVARQGLSSGAETSSQATLEQMCLDYLRSVASRVMRNPASGLQFISEMSPEEFNRYLGLTQLRANDDLGSFVLSERGSSISGPTRHTVALLTLNQDRIPQLIETLAGTFRERGANSSIISVFADQALFLPNIFDALWSFFVLITVAPRLGVESIRVGEREEALSEWSRRFVSFMLTIGQPGSTEGAGIKAETALARPAELELYRRRIHALTLRLATWVTMISGWLTEFSKTATPDDVVRGLAIRGLSLSDRLTPLLVDETGWAVHQIPEELEKLALRLGLSEREAGSWADTFMPLSYGPNGYDHAAAALLAVLDLSWPFTTFGGGTPSWVTPETPALLQAIASRSETEAVRRLVAGREAGWPNRLGVILDKTPQELARQLLHRIDGD